MTHTKIGNEQICTMLYGSFLLLFICFFFWMHVCMCQRISFAMELVVMIDDNRVWGENQLFRLIKIVFVNGDVRHMTRSSSNEQIAYTFANAQHQQQQQRHQHKLCLNLNSLISNEMCEWKRSFSNTVYILLTVHRVSLYLCVLCYEFFLKKSFGTLSSNYVSSVLALIANQCIELSSNSSSSSNHNSIREQSIVGPAVRFSWPKS